MTSSPARSPSPTTELEDLRDRLRRTRWPERETVDDWSQGIPLAYVQELCATWADDYDWRRVEAELNGYEQLRFLPEAGAPDRLGIQVLHAPSPEPDALPVVFTHGWPGSVVEFLDVIEPLRDPRRHGGDPADAIHVVCPSLPGYGFSDKPTEPGWNVDRIGDAWVELMTALGYDRFGAQGGDWGSAVTTSIGDAPRRPVRGDPPQHGLGRARQGSRRADRGRAGGAGERWTTTASGAPGTRRSSRPGRRRSGTGSSTRRPGRRRGSSRSSGRGPTTGATRRTPSRRERLLDNVMHYWLPGAGASSARLYWESFNSFRGGEPIDVPSGMSIFPGEIFRPSRRWAERRFTDIRHWNELDVGGHFAAFEQPAVFVDEVRAFFRAVR